ncbi:MAG TPA: hypothetical protein VJ697_06265, partial [Nitrososphaeraceae archaeon]|nr:hypothetical protein [Nitrososphaeraceae archaeon]
MINNKNYNYSNNNSNLEINIDKSSSISPKEELAAATQISTTQQEEGETKIILDNKEKEQYKDQVSPSITANTTPLEEVKEKTNKYLDNQTQQIKNKTSTISETTNKINNNINQNQDINKAYLDKNINTAANNFQQVTTNTSQSIFNNYIELQKNI